MLVLRPFSRLSEGDALPVQHSPLLQPILLVTVHNHDHQRQLPESVLSLVEASSCGLPQLVLVPDVPHLPQRPDRPQQHSVDSQTHLRLIKKRILENSNKEEALHQNSLVLLVVFVVKQNDLVNHRLNQLVFFCSKVAGKQSVHHPGRDTPHDDRNLISLRKVNVGPVAFRGDMPSSPQQTGAGRVVTSMDRRSPRRKIGNSTKELLENLRRRREETKLIAQRKPSVSSNQGGSSPADPVSESRLSRQNLSYQVKAVLAEQPYQLSLNYLNWMMRGEGRWNHQTKGLDVLRDVKEDDEVVKGAAMNIPSQSQMSMRLRFNVLEMDYSNLSSHSRTS